MKKLDPLLIVIALTGAVPACHRQTEPANQSSGDVKQRLPAARERARLDETVWAREVRSRRYEGVFTDLWDRLLKEENKLEALRRFPFEKLLVGVPSATEKLERGIQVTRFGDPEKEMAPSAWKALLEKLEKQGYRLVESEWHHIGFDAGEESSPRSTVDMVLHVTQEARRLRIIVKGRLQVEWSPDQDERATPTAHTIRVTDLELAARRGEVYFKKRLEANGADAAAPERGVQPLIVYDLDRDGLPEIVLGGMNRIYWNLGKGRFEWDRLCRFPVRMFKPGIIADFTGDGRPDFICVSRDGVARLYVADQKGRYSTPTRQFLPDKLEFPSVLTAGDIDHDDDLDLWIGQYKPPYQQGQMPTPYYDASDGHPAYLLLNDGAGNFSDVTEVAGLSGKRHRRTYSSSLVDLDEDGHLDLLVVSDFAGIDLYLGDGKGRFRDATGELVEEHHSFGMAHSFADFDGDAKLDFYIIGMSSTTANRLESMGLERSDFPEHNRMRKLMAYGNRMYLRRGERYEEPPFRDQVARTGWSWGATTFDLDNDGDVDVYVANGHRSGDSTEDFCTRFWCHDIYSGSSAPDRELLDVFAKETKPVLEQRISWDGYQHNALFLNQAGGGEASGRRFRDVGFLMGVAFEFDARGVVSADLDADGRLDLLVVEQRWEPVSQVLHVLQNLCPERGNWIGVRLAEEEGAPSPIGARITVRSPAGTRVDSVVTGDSFYSQHPTIKHFGLAAARSVDWIEVLWVSGEQTRLENPAINTYHEVRAP